MGDSGLHLEDKVKVTKLLERTLAQMPDNSEYSNNDCSHFH